MTTSKTYVGTFCDRTFTISNVKVDDDPVWPNVTFTLTTDYGTEKIYEGILDGRLAIADEVWVDRLSAPPESEEELSELLYEVNECLRPLVAPTALDHAAIDAMADQLGLVLCRNDGPIEWTWTLQNDGVVEYHASSLHDIREELNSRGKAC